jgi:hypothetical protein
MEKNYTCPFHKEGHTKEDYFLGNKILICDYAKNKGCPYGNSQELRWEAGESPTISCESEGLVRKLKKKEI